MDRSGFTIRRCEDFDLLSEIEKIVFDSTVDRMKPDSLWWLARYDGEPAGICSLTLHPEHDCCELSLCGVVPEFRGYGLQRRLIRVRERYGRQHGFERAVSYTRPWNFASANNLIRCGFELYEPEYKWGYKDCLYFRKRLRAREVRFSGIR